MTVETYTPIKTLEAGQTYEQTFLIAAINHNDRMKTGNGKTFALVTLRDVTGDIQGVIWGYADNLSEGQYAIIRLDTKLYRGNMEFHAQAYDIRPLNETPINKHDYIKGVSESLLVHYASEAEESVLDIEDPVYRDVVCSAIHKLNLLSALKSSPYGLVGPMTYHGGLLVHVVHALRFCKIANKQATELEVPFSSSLVIAGCLLRNVGWVEATEFRDNELRTRDVYLMTGIQGASVKYIDRLMIECEKDLQITIPLAKRQALENMCNPLEKIHTLEGKIVSYADDMANTLDLCGASLQRKQRGNWTSELFIGHL